jgi:hypothetical protein
LALNDSFELLAKRKGRGGMSKSSDNFLGLITVLLGIHFLMSGWANLKVIGTDLRPQPNVHNETHTTINQDIKVDRRTDCRFLTWGCSGGGD